MTILGFLYQTGLAPPVITAWAFWHYFSMFRRRSARASTEFGRAKDAVSPALASAGAIWLVELTFRLMAFEWFGRVHVANLYAANIALSSLLTTALVWIVWRTRAVNVFLPILKPKKNNKSIAGIFWLYLSGTSIIYGIIIVLYILILYHDTSLDETGLVRSTGPRQLLVHPLVIGRPDVGFLWVLTSFFGLVVAFHCFLSILFTRQIKSKLKAR